MRKKAKKIAITLLSGVAIVVGVNFLHNLNNSSNDALGNNKISAEDIDPSLVSDKTEVLYTGKTTSTLNVRSAGEESYSKIGDIKEGTKVEIVDELSNGWYKIKYNDEYGYISSEDVKLNKKIENLENFLFVGDSYTFLLKDTIKANNENVYVHAKSGSMPSYWLDKVDDMPSDSKVEGIVLLIGVNGAAYESNKTDVKTLIDKLSAKYPDKQIYVQKIFPVGTNFTSADPTKFNSKIAALNEVISSHCEEVPNATFIDTTSGLVTDKGYLKYTNDGLHIEQSHFDLFYKNILEAVKNAAQ